MERSRLVPIAIALAAGIAAILCTTLEQRIIVGIALSGICAWCTTNTASAALRASVIMALGCGMLACYVRAADSPEFNRSLTQRYSTTILSCAGATAAAVECTLRLNDGRQLLAYFSRAPGPPGTCAIVRGRMASFDAPRNPGEPDRRALERERGLSAMLEGATLLRTCGAAPNDNWAVILARLHEAAMQRLQSHLAEPYASIIAGELWGERANLPPDLRAEFQDTGTVHVLVTAGLHLGVVALVVSLALAALNLPRAYTCGLTAAFVWAYAAFSGGHLPAMRAASMITFALAGRAAGAKALSWNALAAAAIVVLLADPRAILSASFAMSFSCVGSILLLAPHIDAALEVLLALPEKIREALTLTIATQIGVWPLTAATFLLFAPYALLANAAVVPMVGVTMILGGLQIAFAGFETLAAAFANLNSWLLACMLAVVRLTSALPHAHIIMTPAPGWAIIVYDLAVIGAVWLWSRGARTAAAAVIIVAVFNVLYPPVTYARNLRITMIDVAQADAILIQTPAGHAILVDAGGRLERGARSAGDSAAERVGDATVVPFLIRSGIHHVDALLVSHPHGDHVGGAAPVLRTLGADEFADTGQQYGGFAYHDALSVLQTQKTPIVYPRAGMVWRTSDGVTFTFLGPQTPFITGSRNDINNNSLVFMLEYKSFRMLFTGDAGAEAEQRILSEGVDLHATVLKVGHHGSAYSSTPRFIEAVRPKYAVISVGRHNLFGHPAPSTIETLQRIGAAVYRTDKNGAIFVVSDGGRSAISPYMP